MKIPPLLVLLCLAPLLACSSTMSRIGIGDESAESAPALSGMAVRSAGFNGPSMDMTQGETTPRARALIRTGSLDVEVEDLEAASAEAEAIVTNAQGYGDQKRQNGEESIHFQFRVPAESLDTTMDALAELGEPTARSAQSIDVTGQLIDLEAKISNLRSLRDRLRALLDRATKIEEILSIERELNRVQSELDSLEGRNKRLSKDVALSRLSLNLVQAKPAPIPGPLGAIGYGAWWLIEKLFVIRY